MVAIAALDAVPAPGTKRVAVRVTPDAERQVRGGHPWVFEGSITSLGHEAAPGDLAVIFDRNRDFLAIGLYDPSSPIRVRVLHQGSPTPVDDAWFASSVGKAIDRRAGSLPSMDEPTGAVATDAYRVIHGENDGLGGLVVDRYGDRLVVELFSPAWFPHLQAVLAALVDRLAPEQMVLRLAGLVRRGETHGLSDGQVLLGPADTLASFRENGLAFGADLAHGQKTGHFLDQRDNRQRVRDLAAGASVLDVFSCTGGFSVHAAAGGARTVTSVDQSSPALDAARANMATNAAVIGAATRHDTVAGDAFEVMARLARENRRYDIVIVDPPSFARRGSQVRGALDAYRRLAGLGVPLVAPGGVFVQASCSARIDADTLESVVDAAVDRTGRRVDERWVTGQPVDHPIGFAQGAYLDAVWSRL